MLAAGLAALLAAWFAVPAVAAPPPQARALLEELGGDEFAVRQRATMALLAMNELNAQDIAELYAAAGSDEQRARLMRIAKHHFVRPIQEERSRGDGPPPPGSLGVSLVASVTAVQFPELGRSAARIGATYPGFPAFVYLQSGDLIVSVDDQPLPERGDEAQVRDRFVQLIHAKGAGNTVKLGVYRDGQLMNLTIRLAGYEALISMYQLGDSAALRPMYQVRWEQLRRAMLERRPAAPPLTVDLDLVPPAPAEPRPEGIEPISHVKGLRVEEAVLRARLDAWKANRGPPAP